MEWFIGILPIAAIAILCPLMMFFMMRGGHGSHGGQGEHSGHAQPQDQDATAGDDARLRQLEGELDALRHRRAGP